MNKHELKYNLVIDIIEHPDNYTPERLAEILSDPAVKEIYNLICEADSALQINREIDVDAEWKNFSENHLAHSGYHFMWSGNRAASIAVIACMSIVAVAAGIAVSMAVIDRRPEPMTITETTTSIPAVSVPIITSLTQADTINADMTPVIFENEPLDIILKKVAGIYGVEIKFNNKEAASLHLYYKLDPSLRLDEVVSQLNTFEQIKINRKGNILTLD